MRKVLANSGMWRIQRIWLARGSGLSKKFHSSSRYRPGPSRHERRRLQTRQRLIQTALQLVLEKGYNAISIQDITDRADLGRGTFYIHFKDKEDVVWAAFRDLYQALEQEAHQRRDRGRQP